MYCEEEEIREENSGDSRLLNYDEVLSPNAGVQLFSSSSPLPPIQPSVEPQQCFRLSGFATRCKFNSKWCWLSACIRYAAAIVAPVEKLRHRRLRPWSTSRRACS